MPEQKSANSLPAMPLPKTYDPVSRGAARRERSPPIASGPRDGGAAEPSSEGTSGGSAVGNATGPTMGWGP